MNDAISRSALVNDMKGVVFREKPFGNADIDALYKSLKNMYSGMIYLVETAPALDVAPVVHARWNKSDGTCSACNHEAFYDEWTEPKWDYDWDENLVQTGEETHIQFIFSPYCPNCGARMDGDAHG